MKPYEGKLAQRQTEQPRLSLPEFVNRDEQKIQAERLEHFVTHLDLLIEHYELTPGPNILVQLLWHLMRHHVPAFQEAEPKSKPANRPLEWTFYNQMLLVARVEQIKMRGASQRQACLDLVNSGLYADIPFQSLVRRVQKSRDALGPHIIGLLGERSTRSQVLEIWVPLLESMIEESAKSDFYF